MHEIAATAPHGLSLTGDEIPLEAAILSVADAYEAMTSDRPYRPALGSAAAQAELEREAGTQFDERVIRAFLSALRGSEARGRRRAGKHQEAAS